MEIIFTNTSLMDGSVIKKPEPASFTIPDWYKELSSYIGEKKQPNGQGSNSGTIKRCMPVFDAMVAGYILYTPTDIWVSQRDGNPWYEWPSLGAIKFHPIEQAPNYPNRNGHNVSYPKWMNPWAIKTEPGYSVIFVQPFHRKSAFTILPGIVDTDKYDAAVNFPFVLNDIKFEGLIPAGTPMAQVIPFKRESWKMKIGTKKDLENQKKTTDFLSSRFFDTYKTFFRQTKEYK